MCMLRDSVNAVADLLAEQGRRFHDAKSLKDAVGQYEFLRVQYPGSSLRVGALLAEAEIYENDLHDAAAAKERYGLLVKQHPRSAQAEEARAGIASLSAGSRDEGVGSSRQKSGAKATAGESEGGSSFAPMPVTALETGEARAAKTATPGSAVDAERSGVSAPVDAELDASTAAVLGGERSAAPVALHVAKSSAKRHGMAQVTGIRHWSTPDYTRVAIDLGDDVTYEAARVPNPDRIYFDLHGTRLAQELVGKSFAVTDDGFPEEDSRCAVFERHDAGGAGCERCDGVLGVSAAESLSFDYRYSWREGAAGCSGGERADAAGGCRCSYGAEYYCGEVGELDRCGGVERAAGEGGGDDTADFAADLGGGSKSRE